MVIRFELGLLYSLVIFSITRKYTQHTHDKLMFIYRIQIINGSTFEI